MATLVAQGIDPTTLPPGAVSGTTPPTQPVSQTSTTPAPVQTTPSAPTATTAPTTQSGPLAMPATGSVVDLLNASGQDSSYTARQQLAQQYGIQNYSGSAAQNQELSKKYLEAYNKLKTTAPPQNAAEARTALDTYQQATQPTQQGNPMQQFMDMYGSMNPIEANLYQQLSGLLTTSTNQQTLTDFYKQESATLGIPELNLQLADIKKIMDGTEDDIRDEIQNAGGFATESQVQAMVGARNKNLLKQATYLSDVINAKNDYLDNIVSLTKADREQVGKDLDRKLGITQTLITMSQRMEDNVRENYKTIVNSVGWEGLANTLKGNSKQMANVEKIFGFAPGELQTLSTMKKPLTETERVQLENLKLQGQKLKQDLATGPDVSTTLQNFGTTADPHYKLINSKTGSVIADYGSSVPQGDKTQQLALSQSNIADTDSLLTSVGLNSAVGPNFASRIPIFDAFGAKSNFIAGVEQLRGQLTLQNLQNAKAGGATFGALSDSELALLSSSASKIGTWAKKDTAGNITGYEVDEATFKKELDKINNFQKLDFVLKGGSPTAVGLIQQADGSYWSKNSDGTYSKIQ